MNRSLNLIILFVAALSCGCAKLEELTGREVHGASSVPESKATADEQAAIDTTLDEISNLTEKFGPRKTFDTIPIVVNDEDMNKTKRGGFCSYGPSYISINKAVFKPGSDDESNLFNILLHEIGHCYFGRAHDQTTFFKDGFWVSVTTRDYVRRRATSQLENEICVSMMCTSSQSTGLTKPPTPYQLREYYVGEILQKIRARKLSDFEKFGDVQFLAKAKAFQGKVESVP